MTWAKLDDKFHSHPKALRAWTREPAAVGLHAMALSWVAAHETDGRLAPEFVSQLLDDEAKASAVKTLVEVGLWEPNGEGWMIHDYTDWNPSRAELEVKRESDRKRKRASARNPSGGGGDE